MSSSNFNHLFTDFNPYYDVREDHFNSINHPNYASPSTSQYTVSVPNSNIALNYETDYQTYTLLDSVPTQTQDNTSKLQSRISELEQEIKSQQVKLNEILKILERVDRNILINKVVNQVAEGSIDLNKIIPLKTVEQMENKEFFQQIKFKLMLIVGQSNIPGTGYNCSYSLIDNMFDRILLTSFTWTGSSSNNTKKLAFVVYKNITRIFFETIYAADNSFSFSNVIDFFQNKALKYSKTRATKRKNSRASTVRQVAKRRRVSSDSFSSESNVSN